MDCATLEDIILDGARDDTIGAMSMLEASHLIVYEPEID